MFQILRFCQGANTINTCQQTPRRAKTPPGKLSRLLVTAGVASLVVVGWCLTLGVADAQKSFDIDCQPDKVCREKETLLPLRALPRPNSNIYKSKNNNAENVLTENVRAFYPVYVFSREELDLSDPADPKGWYRIGATIDQPSGWMQAKDVMEWRQALVVSYTHPGVGEGTRHPVLMFNTLQDLQTVVEAPDRKEQANQLYEQVRNRQKPTTVISIEPSRFVDIENTFYILPVLDFRVEDRFDGETRLLQAAAAVPQKRSNASTKTTLQDLEFRKTVTPGDSAVSSNTKNLTADIVFVMDLTASMGPYIEATRQAVMKLAQTVTQNPAVKEAVNFGLIGYRDNLQMMPELEFTAKNFTPKLLKDQDFVSLVDKEVRAAQIGSGDYPEEVYAGLKLALDETQWSGGLRFLVLVSDASAHEADHPQSTTRLGAAELRQLANQADAFTFVIHLQEARAKEDHPVAASQFAILATNPGITEPAVFTVDTAKPENFDAFVKSISGRTADIIAQARKGADIDPQKVAGGQPPSQELKDLMGEDIESPEVKKAAQMIDEVAAAALVNYLGGEPVRDITFWAIDRDLVDPAKKGLEVRVLVNRDELSDLILALERVTDAINATDFTQMKFFESLQAIMSQVSKGQPISFDKAQRLAATGLMPKWIESLPYKSTILDMSDERFEALTPAERAELDRSLKAKLQLYRDISEKVNVWKPLDERDQGSNRNLVYPIPLIYLP